MQKFCKDLKHYAIERINYREKEMIPLKSEKNKSHYNKNIATYVSRNLKMMIT